jgi:hypothetical protein
LAEELFLWVDTTALATWLRESASIWAYPTVLTLHTVGLAVLVGASAALDIRLLGFGAAIPLPALARSFRVMWIGFWLNAITGAILFIAAASRHGASSVFRWKLAIIALCVVNIWLIQRAVYPAGRAATAAGAVPKLLAVSSLALWLVAIALGRWMAYAV